MSEAVKYTTEMWQRHLGQVVSTVGQSDSKRRAFVAGFKGRPRSAVHHTARDAWALGRHSAVLLGYIKPQPGSE